MSETVPAAIDPFLLALDQVWDDVQGFQFHSAASPDYSWPPPPRPTGIVDVWFTAVGARPWGLRVPVPGRGQIWVGFDQSASPIMWALSVVDWIDLQVRNDFPSWAEHVDDGIVRYLLVDQTGRVERRG